MGNPVGRGGWETGDPATALGLDDQPVEDYGEVDPVHWSDPWTGTGVKVLTALGALLVGFLLTVGLDTGRTVAREQDVRRAELIELINARQGHTEALSQQIEELRARVAVAEEDAAARVPALRGQVQTMEQAAGLTRLAGPGLRVTLADASGTCPTGRVEDCRIQDTDLQLMVNTLFALGAEAVAVNGERVIATTAIRGAGRTVLVNYRVLTSPYVVEAIGDPGGLHDGLRTSELAEDLAVWRDVYGLGFSIESIERVVLPGYGGSVRLRTATVAGGSS